MPFFLAVLTISMLCLIEVRHPYFFLKDDSMVLSLPLYVHNLRALMGGEFPQFNFHQYLGMPVGNQSNSYYAINYLALVLSKATLGHYFGTMEYLAVLHLVAAALGFYFLMRNFEIREICCCTGAIAWTFSAFVMTVGNSWIQVVCYAAYLPWILLYSIRLVHGFTKKDFTILVILRVGALFVGHPQYFWYVMTFDFITALSVWIAVARTRPTDAPAGVFDAVPVRLGLVTFLWWYLCSCIITAGIALPMVLQTLREAAASESRSRTLPWEMYISGSYDLKLWLRGLVAPFADVQFATWNDLHFISHIGYLPIAFIIVALISVRTSKNGTYISLFSGLAFGSLLWAGGTVVTGLFYYLPVYNKFTTPFKLAFFTSFFLVVVSTFGADIVYEKILHKFGRSPASRFFKVLLALLAANFLILYMALPQHAFMKFTDKIPLEEPLRRMLNENGGRIVSAGPDIKWNGAKAVPGFSAPLLGYNYATLWGLYHSGGYWGLVSRNNFSATLGMTNSSIFNLPADIPFSVPPDTLEHYREWGVTWYLVDSRIPLPADNDFKLVHSDQLRNLLYDGGGRPMFYWPDSHGVSGLAHRFKINSVRVDTERGVDAQLVVNVLYHPFFSATLDGVGVPVAQTPKGQMLLTIPKGRHSVVISYSDPYFVYGSLFSLGLIMLFAASGVITHYRSRRLQRVDV